MSAKLIKRKEYLSKLGIWRDKKVIKVITGIRRCGKSSLFSLFIDLLKESGVDEKNILLINLEDMNNQSLLTYETLHEFITKRLDGENKTYVFLDEVQQCRNFERAVSSLYLRDDIDLYITGSNAMLLSGDIATLLSGRYVEIKMLPLSFSEYLQFEKPGINTREAFSDYLKYGSFPYIPELDKDKTIINGYLEGVYNTVIVKDLISREKIRDVTVLEDVVKFLCSSVGSPISIKKISDTLNSAGRKISVNTVEQYVRALTDSFVIYKVDRYDIKGKQHLKTQNKYYIVDTGIRNMLLSAASPDTGHVLENIIYLELIRRDNQVNIGKIGEKEIDFVAENNNYGRCYYQVAATVLDENTLLRELEPLQRIDDHFSKILLTMDEIGNDSYHNGIKQMNIIDWLMEY